MLYVVAALLLLHLTLISVQVEDPSGTLLLKRWILTVGAPILSGTASLSRGASSLWHDYVWLRGAREENERLQETVHRISLLNSSLEQMREENVRLQKLLGFEEIVPYQTVGARVVGRAPNFLAGTLYLDRGSRDGVRSDLPVVSAFGIVGRTVLVTPHGCQVQLLTNADASTGVMVERTRSPGVARGTENLLLDLNYINNTEEVNAGDVVVTSGLDGIYPKGLPVGRVTDSEKGKTGFRSIRVEPSADLLRIEEVLILLNAPKPGGAVPAPGPGR